MRAKDIPPHLHARYGIRPPSPWRWVAITAALLVVVPAGLYAATRYVVTQQVSYALISWSAPDDAHVAVLWHLDAAEETRWCSLRAQDFEHFDLGFAVVPVPAGRTEARYLMHTLGHPLAVDVVACEVDPFALMGPQFRPGVLPPRQDAPGLAPGVHSRSGLGA